MKKLITFALIFFCQISTPKAEIRVLDGDSIVLNGEEIRLIGIDAPEWKQICYLSDEAEYECGEESKFALIEIIKNRQVTCNKVKKDIYKRSLSECFADDLNINLEMLRLGWAVSYYTEDALYIKAEQEAKDEGKGLWQGRFLKPEFHRILYRRK